MGLRPIVAVVTRETRLESLKARWTTMSAATFRLKKAVDHEIEFQQELAMQAGAEFLSVDAMAEIEERADDLAGDAEYEAEDGIYQQTTKRLLSDLEASYPVKRIDRTFLANFDFGRCVAVVVIGPDGLVANAAKYVGDLPIVGVNPDPHRNDGVLLPFKVEQARHAVARALNHQAKYREVTLAEVNTNDGQRMLAFNDFFIGAHGHSSARYTIEAAEGREAQSSSGVLVSTGAGSTGWLSSMFNMAQGFARFGGAPEPHRLTLPWDAQRLIWAVREPFRSRHSSAEMVAGFVEADGELVLASQMPSQGTIFSDGVESDFLEFNSGTIARFRVSEQRARLVVP